MEIKVKKEILSPSVKKLMDEGYPMHKALAMEGLKKEENNKKKKK
jgi:hypothetical protein